MKNSILLLLVSLTGYFMPAHAENHPDIRTILNSQINNTEINVPQGTYLLDLTNNQWEYVFNGKKDIVIEGNGSTIICNRQTRALLFNDCRNVTFRNFIIDYDPPCSTQGSITEISNENRTWTVEIHEGYPMGELGFDRIQAYKKDTRELIPNFGTANVSGQYTKLNERTIRFTIEGWNNNPVRVGDFVVFNALSNPYHAHTIVLESCKFMKFENITIYDSNCFSFLEYDGEANHYYRCVATRKMADVKYKENRLRAGVADAFHSKYAKIGPIIEECTFSYTGDDCIAINGNFYPVCAVNANDPSLSILASGSASEVRVKTGDRLVCVANNGTIRGSAKVTKIREFIPSTTEIQTTFSKLSQVLNASDYTKGIRITLDSKIEGTDAGDVIYSNDRVGSGFQVLRNKVGHNRSRAILIKASDGIIEGNTIENSAMSAIALAPEFYWMEAGCPSNVTIKNNTITNCMFESTMWNVYQFASIVVVAEAPNGGIAPAGTLKNIAIYDNEIVDCPKPCIGVTSTDTLRMYGNNIQAGSWIRHHGGNLGISNQNEIFLKNTIHVIEEPDANKLNVISNARSEQLCIINNRIFVSGLASEVTAKLEIFDLTGKKVMDQSFPLASGASIENLETGTFIAVISGSKTTISGKIMKTCYN